MKLYVCWGTMRLNVGLLEGGWLPAELPSDLRALGSKKFREWGRGAGPRRGGTLKRIGAYYAQAGAELRAVQAQPELDVGSSPWPFDRFPSG